MCGILVIAAAGRDRPSVDLRTALRMRDRMEHRGPDGAGIRAEGPAIIGHRRLAIIDPAGGDQPWIEPPCPGAGDSTIEGELVLAYNGELFDADRLRADLPGPWRTRCDTEVVARVLQRHGAAGLPMLRGMYAIAAWWPKRRVLLLARDPLGIKPLHWSVVDAPGGPEVVAASEIPAILDHPHVRAEPDWATVSSYLSTIRLTLGDRSLYHGIRTLRPGERVRFDLSASSPRPLHGQDERLSTIWPSADPAPIDDAAVEETRSVVESSIRSHLVADVPVGAMLSGGIDSTVIAATIRGEGRDLRTWCAGARESIDAEGGDPHHAAMAARALDTRHETVGLTRSDFAERWPWLVERLGLPLGTPNEVAIHAVAQSARAHVPVLIGGEGADELFAGYGGAVDAILRRSESFIPGAPVPSATSVLIEVSSWIPPALKPRVLTPDALDAAGHDVELLEDLQRDTAAADARPGDPRPLLAALGRRNLAGLLARLDTATMLESIEARVPFADPMVALAAARMPLSRLAARVGAEVPIPTAGAAGVAPAAESRLETKRILRQAFRGRVPDAIARRPKASFPLPLAEWVADGVDALDSASARTVLREDAIATVRSDPRGHALAAWPMINIARWLSRWD